MAAVVTPLPSVVNVTGLLIFSKPTQFRPPAPNVACRRVARKVNRVFAVAGAVVLAGAGIASIGAPVILVVAAIALLVAGAVALMKALFAMFGGAAGSAVTGF